MSLKSKSRRYFWVPALVLAFGSLLVVFFGRGRTQVETRRITRGSFERSVEEDGRARVRDRFVVSAPVAATVERTGHRVGDTLAQGDVVATLLPLPGPLLDARSRAELEQRRGAAEAALGAARIALSRAQTRQEHAETELARMRTLAKSGSIASRELELAELGMNLATRERDQARFSVHMAEHELEVARSALASVARAGSQPPERFEIKTPVAGRVLRVYQESEGPVSVGTPLLEIGDPSALEIVVDLLSLDAVQVTPGAEVEITRWGGPDSLAGRVRLVEPIANVKVSALGVEEQRVNVLIDPSGGSPLWSRVGDGYRVDARVVVERLDHVLRVPTSALFREQSEWRVFVVEDGRARKRSVKLRAYAPLQSAVESGLGEGTIVIERPADSLREGTRVRAAEETAELGMQ